MPDFNTRLFLPFAKVDPDQRMVYGWASTPTKDLQDERVSVEAIKAALPEYLPWGNIREMHQPSAVGVCKNAEIVEGGDRDREGLYIAAKIVDDDAWIKCKEGVYKGFSIGGEKLEKVGDLVTKLKLYEISIVDRPANPECRIDYFKAVGLDQGGGVGPVGSDVRFDRREMGFMARMFAKATGQLPENYARDGFSRPAPDVVNGGNPENRRPVGFVEPQPHVLNSPSGITIPSQDHALADIPLEDRDRILLMAGKYHVFGKKSVPISGSPFSDLKDAVAALRNHLDEMKADKMVRKARNRAEKLAKVEKRPVSLAKAFRREQKFLAKRGIEKGHRRFLKTMIEVLQPTAKVAKRLTRGTLVKALEHIQGSKPRKLYKRRDLDAIEKGIIGTLSARGLLKKEESTANVNDLPDKDFAHISSGGSKDESGKTTPRSLRHLPIHDSSHVRNAAARLNQTDIPADAKAQAHRKIKARGKEFGVDVSDGDSKTDKAAKAAKKALRKNRMSAAIDELRSIQQSTPAVVVDEPVVEQPKEGLDEGNGEIFFQ
jgi:hypothetical protein